MEELIEEVVSQAFGLRWQQFYHRLGLQFRDRYRIEVEHKDKAEADKIRCCMKDTIGLWLKSAAVVKQSEREKMKTLLDTLSSVQGFETVALELSGKYGVHLEKAMPVHKHIQPAISLRASSGSSPGASEFSLKLRFPDHKARQSRVEYDGATPLTEHEAPSTDSSPSQGHHDMESAHLPQSSELVLTEQLEVESSSSYSVPLSTASERAAKQESFQVQIDMANIVHKFAVLDVVQRISLNHWTRFSSLLGLSKETIELLSREKASEERYYKSIKEWLKVNRGATFAALSELLEQCNEQRAQIVMRKRLECNRDTQLSAT